MREKIAILLPCYNEEKPLRKIIKDFKNVYQRLTFMFMIIIQAIIL